MPAPLHTATDQELIAAAIDGDTAAFGALVGRHQQAAIRIAALALGTAEGADDVAQEAFVKAHGALDRFRHGSSFTPWLFRIVTNSARNRQRGQGRHRALSVRIAGRAPVGVDADGPDELAVRAGERQELVAAINRLRPDDRLILAHRWYHDLSEAEIAEALGCRRGTVKSRLSRAMDRLRAELAEPGPNPQGEDP